MNVKVGGQRPRPRVALLGEFEDGDIEKFSRMFPTLWAAPNIDTLRDLVDVREVDLLIIASNIDYVGDWSYSAHVICFSSKINQLPGPTPSSFIQTSGTAETEEFIFPSIPLHLGRLRDADFGNLTSVRGWLKLSCSFPYHPRGGGASKTEQQTAQTSFNNGALIGERTTNSPLAVYFVRDVKNLGVSWLPCVVTNQASWVEAILTYWAPFDKESFSSYGDWMNLSQWMVPEEEEILSHIYALERKKQDISLEIDKDIGKLLDKFSSVKSKTNSGLRRLITEQSNPLVDEVTNVLSTIGFEVTNVDKIVGDSKPKREDLRLQHSDKTFGNWNAIVEVRGYARSSGTTADLLRLDRFSNLYQKETGHLPDKLIYIVNGQIELSPSIRQAPLVSAQEDLQIFSDNNGVLIWSIDLFRAIKSTPPSDYPTLLESIKLALGRWVPFNVTPVNKD